MVIEMRIAANHESSIRTILKRTPSSLKALSRNLGINQASVRTILNRMPDVKNRPIIPHPITGLGGRRKDILIWYIDQIPK